NFTNLLTTNVGTMRNRGIEFSVNAKVLEPRADGLGWTAGFTVSHNGNELLSINPNRTLSQINVGPIGGGTGNTIQVLMPGHPINSFFVCQQYYQDGKPVQNTYVPLVQNAARDSTVQGCTNDLRPFHSPWPTVELGHSSYFTFHKFDLSFTLRAQLGSYVYNNVAASNGSYQNITSGNVTPTNMDASVLKTGFTAPQFLSDFYVQDASFLRMDNITLGCSFQYGGRPWRAYPTVAPKSAVTGANIWADPNAYAQYMAKLYAGLVVTSQIGPNDPGDKNGDIKLIDEGTSEFLRLNWYLQELPTDEAVIGWNDPGVPDLNRWQWNSTNTISQAMYYRVYFETVLANEFLRQTTPSLLDSRGVSAALKARIKEYRAEARFLRALAYWVGLDFFGDIPLVTEADPIGGPPPKQIARDSVYRYVVSELQAIVDSLLTPNGAITYGRATPATANMLLAEVYLNAGVYTGTPDYAGALTAASNVISSGQYTLESN